ncbi:hypothetical protein ACHWQZ_G008678 [Mnemiopsis leidyi]
MTDKDAVAALFKFFDDDDSQGLTLEELKAGMISVGSNISETEVKAFFDKYDTDKNGIIDFKEFLGLCMDLNTNESEKAIAQLFQAVDKNGDRTLSNEELRIGIANYTGKPLEDKELNDLIKQLDIDGDGEISYSEFTNSLLVKITLAVKGN